MGNMNTLSILFIAYILVHPGEASIFNSSSQLSNNNQPSVDGETDSPQKTNEIFLKPLHTIDLETCKCLPKDDYCQIAIAKSIVMEISCPEELNYCCNATAIAKQELEKPKSPKVNIFIPTAIESESKEAPKDPNNFSENTNGSNANATSIANEKQKPKCRCKPRNKCLSKYVDYRFGFDCSYSTVRCCEPESLILKEKEDALLESGKIILPGNKQSFSEKSPDDLTTTNNKTTEDCLCLPINRCKIDPNTISKRKDTLCPYDLIQCCGDSISDTKEDVQFSANFSPDGNLPDSKISEARVGTGPGVTMLGQPAFWQPVQLPVLKIPSKAEQDSQVEAVSSSTMTPPQLPTHYYYQPPGYQMDFYRPSSPSQYSNTPWTSLTQTSPYYASQYSRYHPGYAEIHPSVQYESPRSSDDSPTFLKTIANLLG